MGLPIGGGGLGIGTIIVLGLIGYAFGIDPRILIGGAEMLSHGSAPSYQADRRSPGKTGAPKDEMGDIRSEEHTSESSHQIISYAVFCLKKKQIARFTALTTIPTDRILSAATLDAVISASKPFSEDNILRVPRGAYAGQCLHRLFEYADLSTPCDWPAAIERTLREYPELARRNDDDRLSAMMMAMLNDVAASELIPGLRLNAVESANQFGRGHIIQHRHHHGAQTIIIIPARQFGILAQRALNRRGPVARR